MRLVNMIAIGVLLSLPAGAAKVVVPLPQAPQRHVQVGGLFDWLFGGSWERRKPVFRQHPRRRKEPLSEDLRTSSDGTYRTLCVRLCDGFYFPISFATTRGNFAEDAARCERQCPTRSRLYAYRNPGQEIEEMVGLDGTPYMKLPTAFRFRSGYVANCTCQGNPWDAEAIARHQSYLPAQSTTAFALSAARRHALEPRYSRYRSQARRDRYTSTASPKWQETE
jgi:hypothetical protein